MLHIWGYGVIFHLRERHSTGKTQSLDHPRRLFTTFLRIYRENFNAITLVFTLFLTNIIRYTLDNNTVTN
jgi:uncharacterized membrane protein YesL